MPPRPQLEQFFLREWQRGSAWQMVLRPLSWLFAALAAMRRALYAAGVLRRYRVPVPVVVVGNISVGGTGKTPLVLALSRFFTDAGDTPGIVTRGYQRPGAGMSDEALLLTRRSGVPVVADARRAAAVQALLAGHPQTNVVISDDGLQHQALARDVEIAVVDGSRGFGNGCLLPAGPLREAPSRLHSVDCIVLNNTNIDGQFEAKMPQTAHGLDTLPNILHATGRPVFEMHYGNESFVSLEGAGLALPAAMLETSRGKRVAAVAGIGHPQRYFDHLARLGFTLTSRHAFADHHAFARENFSAIDADIILMTEKDAVKCADFADGRMWAMHIDALLPEAFYQFIRKKVDHVTRPQAA